MTRNGRGSSTPSTSYARGSSSADALAGVEVDPLGEGGRDFVLFGARAATPALLAQPDLGLHRLGLALPLPPDLLHPVEQLVGVSIGIVEIRVPVRARPIAAGVSHFDVGTGGASVAPIHSLLTGLLAPNGMVIGP